jgi:hypothetical protein
MAQSDCKGLKKKELPMSKSLKALLGAYTPQTLPQDHSNLVPTGQYTSTINKVEEKTSAAGHDYLSVWHKLSGNGHYNNSMVFDHLNVGHPDAEVRRQAFGKLNALIRSAGLIAGEGDTLDGMVAALPGCNSTIYVTRRDGKGGYGPSNNVSRYVH